jgi:UDP-2,3-diacylglucosamine hydrolase
MGEFFCDLTGAQLLPDPSVINLYGQNTLLLHGDSLCTDDTEYMTFRQQARSKAWQEQLLAQPIAARRLLAKQLREKSLSMNALKAEDIMDVNHNEVIAAMEQYNVKQMIHGHTHRPQRHPLSINNMPAERIVLGDWCQQGWVLVATPESLELQPFAL